LLQHTKSKPAGPLVHVDQAHAIEAALKAVLAPRATEVIQNTGVTAAQRIDPGNGDAAEKRGARSTCPGARALDTGLLAWPGAKQAAGDHVRLVFMPRVF
jgi:hypothetical protein